MAGSMPILVSKHDAPWLARGCARRRCSCGESRSALPPTSVSPAGFRQRVNESAHADRGFGQQRSSYVLGGWQQDISHGGLPDTRQARLGRLNQWCERYSSTERWTAIQKEACHSGTAPGMSESRPRSRRALAVQAAASCAPSRPILSMAPVAAVARYGGSAAEKQ